MKHWTISLTEAVQSPAWEIFQTQLPRVWAICSQLGISPCFQRWDGLLTTRMILVVRLLLSKGSIYPFWFMTFFCMLENEICLYNRFLFSVHSASDRLDPPSFSTVLWPLRSFPFAHVYEQSFLSTVTDVLISTIYTSGQIYRNNRDKVFTRKVNIHWQS